MKPFFTIRLIGCLISVVLLSCNKNHPPITTSQTFTIDENPDSGTYVGQVIAIDEDEGQTLTYSIIAGNTNNCFQISENNGTITVRDGDTPDYETNPGFILVIKATDSKGKSALAQVTINVTDLDPPTNDLLIYLPFDGNLEDQGPNNNDGINHTSGNYITGKWAQALDFNGTSDYVQLTNTLNSSNGISFSFWIKTGGVAGSGFNPAIISKYSMADNRRCFLIRTYGPTGNRNGNNMCATFFKYGTTVSSKDDLLSYMETSELSYYGTPATYSLTNPQLYETGIWTHIAINLTSSTLEIWINGSLTTEKNREYNLYFDSSLEPIILGNIISGGTSENHYKGALDELRIYSRALTDKEIKTLFKEH